MANVLSWAAANSMIISIGLVIYVAGAIITWFILRKSNKSEFDCNTCFREDDACHSGICVEAEMERRPKNENGSIFEDDDAMYEAFIAVCCILGSIFWFPLLIIWILMMLWDGLHFLKNWGKEAFFTLLFIGALIFLPDEGGPDLDEIIKG